MRLCLRPIDNARDFMALAPIWSRLVSESGQTSPFLSYDWFWCCWHGVWPQRHPEILVVEEAGTPVAIVPLMHWRAWGHGVPIRFMGFLECPYTPMVDLVIADRHDRVIELVLGHLTARSDWDIVWLQNLPSTSPTVKTLENILPGRLPWRRAGHSFRPYVAIDGYGDSVCDAVSWPYTPNHYDGHEQLQRAGDICIEEHRAVDLQDPFLREALAAISRSSHTERCVASRTMPRTAEFFRELTRRAAKNGWLSLWSLRLNGQVIALEYQLRSHGKVQAVWAGENPDYRGFFPGRALYLAILRSLFESGCIYEYAIGPGVQDDRRLWTGACHETVHFKLYRASLYTRLLRWLETENVSEGPR
jgi:hypothetical protein